MTSPDPMMQLAIADCADRIRQTIEAIDHIEKDRWRIFEQHGDEELRDVTQEYLARHRGALAQAIEIKAVINDFRAKS